MKLLLRNVLMLACLQVGISGCGQTANDQSEFETASMQVGDDIETKESDQSEVDEKTIPKGWTLYSPPEKTFSVLAPEASVEVSSREFAFGQYQSYFFKKGDTPHFEVRFHTDRKGELGGNSVEELKDDPSDFLPNSLREISLGDMPGIEYRMTGRPGESIFREFCRSDNSLSITLIVYKDTGEGLTEEEVRLFLDSFKLLP